MYHTICKDLWKTFFINKRQIHMKLSKTTNVERWQRLEEKASAKYLNLLAFRSIISVLTGLKQAFRKIARGSPKIWFIVWIIRSANSWEKIYCKTCWLTAKKRQQRRYFCNQRIPNKNL
jgi:hypothetical protein